MASNLILDVDDFDEFLHQNLKVKLLNLQKWSLLTLSANQSICYDQNSEIIIITHSDINTTQSIYKQIKIFDQTISDESN